MSNFTASVFVESKPFSIKSIRLNADELYAIKQAEEIFDSARRTSGENILVCLYQDGKLFRSYPGKDWPPELVVANP